MTDTVAIPLVARLYRKAQRILRAESQNSVGIMRRQSAAITVFAGTTNLTRPGVAGLNYPSDMLRPIMLRERATGVPPYVEMKSQDKLMPDQSPTVRLAIWDFRDDKIWFPEAIADIEVQILYEAAFTDLALVGDTLAIPDLLDPLALMVASAATRSRTENKQADAWWADAMEDLKMIVRSEQAVKAAKGDSWGTS